MAGRSKRLARTPTQHLWALEVVGHCCAQFATRPPGVPLLAHGKQPVRGQGAVRQQLAELPGARGYHAVAGRVEVRRLPLTPLASEGRVMLVREGSGEEREALRADSQALRRADGRVGDPSVGKQL